MAASEPGRSRDGAVRKTLIALLACACVDAAAQDPFGLRTALLQRALDGVRKGHCVDEWPTARLRAYCATALPELRATLQRLGKLESVRLESSRTEARVREETWMLSFARGRIVLTAGVRDGDNEYLQWIPLP